MNPHFRENLHHSTWNESDAKIYGKAVPLPPPLIKPAWWSKGIVQLDSTPEQITDLARVCRWGGPAPLTGSSRDDIWPDGQIPPNTFAVLDFEGAHATPFPFQLASVWRTHTTNYTPYGINFGRHAGGNVAWDRRMAGVDLYDHERALRMDAPLVPILGDVILVEMYMASVDAESIEAFFDSWKLKTLCLRASFPGKSVYALCWGAHADVKPRTLFSDELRHRYARFACEFFDGIWFWGPRQDSSALMADVVALALNPLHRFKGEEAWAK